MRLSTRAETILAMVFAASAIQGEIVLIQSATVPPDFHKVIAGALLGAIGIVGLIWCCVRRNTEGR